MGWLLRVNINDNYTEKIDIKKINKEYQFIGGRCLTSSIINNEVRPECDPLGPENKLVFAPGLLSGGYLSSSNRISIGAKSPLTGGIKESNSGGTTGLYLAQHGIQALVIEGSNNSALFYLLVTEKDCFLVKADELKGFSTFETAAWLKEKHGDKSAMAVIGPAGEQRMTAAGIAHLDLDKKPNRYCGRGGLGAVMGSKGLKAVVVVKPSHNQAEIYDQEKWHGLVKSFAHKIKENPATGKRLPVYGTSNTLETVNELGALPTCNFSTGVFDKAQNLSSQKLRDLIQARGGEGTTTHACMPGCVVRCSNRYPDHRGNVLVAPFEYESIAMLGPNLGIDDFDCIAEMNQICNSFGLDTIETGAALGVCAEAGLLKFGDGKRALELLREVENTTVLGRVIGQGAKIVGKVFGVKRVPVVKGQAIPAYDPRAMKGNGVCYATSPQGADHTAGNALKAKVDHLKPDHQVEVSFNLQTTMAAYDSMGLCVLASGVFNESKEILSDLLNARLGINCTWDDIINLGKKTLQNEISFNRRAGFTIIDDRLPDFMKEEALPPHDTVWDVSDAELQIMWDFNTD